MNGILIFLKKIGLENGIPFEDDLYLDMIITPNGEKIIIDEDELLEARKKEIITQEDVDSAYKTLKEKLKENKDKNIEIQYFKQNPVGRLYKKLGFTLSGETEFHYQMKKTKKN